MRRFSTVTRLFWIGFAVLQLAEPLAVELADGRLEAGSPVSASRVHFEDQANGRCRPVHPSDCALCRFLAQPLVVPAPAVLWLAVRPAPQSRLVEVVRASTHGSTFHPFSRAPPLSA